MQRKSFGNMQCPIARSLERVGEWWSILILRDAFYGVTRFDEFQKSLSIAPNMLTRRLNALVEEGLLERRQYCEKPPRFEYHLTERGRDFRPVMLALMNWGNKHFAPEGKAVVLVDADSGEQVEPVLYDCTHDKRITPDSHYIGLGPVANEGVTRRIERAAELRAAQKAALAE
ncbi:MAG: helix-turn-helix transcriptional regulator [Burkholderiaceae bacterium]|nr:helix-turn-helix transcriptional regulator [Burkholderiaceae bacterium]